jgi:hypothetical protein
MLMLNLPSIPGPSIGANTGIVFANADNPSGIPAKVIAMLLMKFLREIGIV